MLIFILILPNDLAFRLGEEMKRSALALWKLTTLSWEIPRGIESKALILVFQHCREQTRINSLQEKPKQKRGGFGKEKGRHILGA